MLRNRTAAPDGVTVYLAERLGNQLFIYAAGLAQARRLNVPLYFNLGFVTSPRPSRSYEKTNALSAFDTGAIIPEEDRFHRSPFLALPGVPAASAWHNSVPGRLLTFPSKAPVFVERSFRYDSRIKNVEPGVTLLGLFQSWRYFDTISEELLARVTRLLEPSPWYQEMAGSIVPGSGAIALNVRRGDYLAAAQQQLQGLVSPDYYARARDHLCRLGMDGPVYVASDSLPEVLKEFEGLGPLVPLAPPPGTDPLELLLILSRVDGFVAANSTFSWWAGYLGSRNGQVVVAPRPWFTQTGIDTRDLMPRDWLTLDREPRSEALV